MSNCIFCKIISGVIPSERLLDDADFIAIRDIQPHARAHFLVIPKIHVTSLNELFTSVEAQPLASGLLAAAHEVAESQGLKEGYRCVINTGSDAGQMVHHLHLHVLGGEPLRGSFGA